MTPELTTSHRIWGIVTLVVLALLAGTQVGRETPRGQARDSLQQTALRSVQSR